MSRPKAYDPEHGYMYQILCRHWEYTGREYEHCDYAKDRAELVYLKGEYALAYGAGWEFKHIMLPRKYWTT